MRRLGLTKVGTARVANYAQLMGIRSPVSTNPSMILGGLNTGVTALDMAHAYSTVANGGMKVFNPTLGDVRSRPDRDRLDRRTAARATARATVTNRGDAADPPA